MITSTPGLSSSFRHEHLAFVLTFAICNYNLIMGASTHIEKCTVPCRLLAEKTVCVHALTHLLIYLTGSSQASQDTHTSTSGRTGHSNSSSYIFMPFSKAPSIDTYFKQVNEKTAVE